MKPLDYVFWRSSITLKFDSISEAGLANSNSTCLHGRFYQLSKIGANFASSKPGTKIPCFPISMTNGAIYKLVHNHVYILMFMTQHLIFSSLELFNIRLAVFGAFASCMMVQFRVCAFQGEISCVI